MTAADPVWGAARTEVEVAADTLAAVVFADVLPRDETVVLKLVDLVGITLQDLKHASVRFQSRGYQKPRGRTASTADHDAELPGLPTLRSVPTPTLAAQTPNNAAKFAAANPEPGMRLCAKCGPVRGPKPISEFSVKNPATGARHSYCRDCFNIYKRERYLDVATGEKVGAVLRFLVEQDDPCVGETCPRCAMAILSGDEVETDDVIVHHSKCPGS